MVIRKSPEDVDQLDLVHQLRTLSDVDLLTVLFHVMHTKADFNKDADGNVVIRTKINLGD